MICDFPPGWIQTPFPPPQRGIYLHAPPGGARGALLLMDALAPHGTLAEQLATAVKTGCADVELLATAEPYTFATTSKMPGLSVAARVRVTHEGRQRDELRVFTLVDAGDIRLPIVFLGDLNAAEIYQDAIGLVLYSIRR